MRSSVATRDTCQDASAWSKADADSKAYDRSRTLITFHRPTARLNEDAEWNARERSVQLATFHLDTSELNAVLRSNTDDRLVTALVFQSEIGPYAAAAAAGSVTHASTAILRFSSVMFAIAAPAPREVDARVRSKPIRTSDQNQVGRRAPGFGFVAFVRMGVPGGLAQLDCSIFRAWNGPAASIAESRSTWGFAESPDARLHQGGCVVSNRTISCAAFRVAYFWLNSACFAIRSVYIRRSCSQATRGGRAAGSNWPLTPADVFATKEQKSAAASALIVLREHRIRAGPAPKIKPDLITTRSRYAYFWGFPRLKAIFFPFETGTSLRCNV